MCFSGKISNISFPEEPALNCIFRAVRISCCQMSATPGDI